MMREPWPHFPKCFAAVICSAITNQEQCRRDPYRTRELNVVRTLRLAEELAAKGAFVVFISSNQVFDGSRPFIPSDAPLCPRTVYGSQKAETEKGLNLLTEHKAIVRLTKVFHPGLEILSKWRQELLRAEVIHPFSDYICSPVPLDSVVQTIWRVLEAAQRGVWQVSAKEDVSYGEIARMVAHAIRAPVSLVQPVTSPPGLLEHLPRFTTLQTAETNARFQISIPCAKATLKRVLE